MRYLEVKFHDNDFGNPISFGLLKLWQWIHMNNAHILPKKEKDLYMIFEQLYKDGNLKRLLDRTISIEYLHNEVEFATRGLYWDFLCLEKETNPTTWNKAKVNQVNAKEVEHPVSEYLNITLEFHKTKDFTKTWQNSECACLDLETGEVTLF